MGKNKSGAAKAKARKEREAEAHASSLSPRSVFTQADLDKAFERKTLSPREDYSVEIEEEEEHGNGRDSKMAAR